MKHFRIILTTLRIIVTLLFAANILFMVELYNSISERYMNDIEQSLGRADQIEIVDRIVKAGLADADSVVRIQLGLMKSDIGSAKSVEELKKVGYSQGYTRMDIQLISEISKYLHDAYDETIDEPNLTDMEVIFRRDLNFSNYHPDIVRIVTPENKLKDYSNLWEIEYKVNGKTLYYAYISPLTENIMKEMSGVIITSALIAIVLTFGFWYLLHVINRLRTIEEMKDDFTNNMTHELKTPIAIAYAANDALLQFPDPNDEERTKKYLTASLEQLSKLTGLVENILAISMERRKHLVLSIEEINLSELLSSIIENHKLKTDKPCNITLDCPEYVVVNADRIHFSNVIDNLIDNSIKYSGNSVVIQIKADKNSLCISDNGIGIPEKSLPHIFNKFYRVPHGNTNDVRGYGIGLFYVKSIIDKHGWQISVTSKSGKGSDFTIKFKTQ